MNINKSDSKNILGFFKGFGYAFKGILDCVKSERNMRFHIGAAALTIVLMQFYELSGGETSAVFICIGAVISLELLNTAIENTVDMICREKNPYAKTAKDCAAGAVLAAAAASVGVAVKLFWDTEKFAEIFSYFSERPWLAVFLIAGIILWLAWVFSAPVKNKTKDKDKNI